MIFASCSKKKYTSNGESIFFTGKSLDGRILQDINASDMKMLHSCSDCHGKTGSGSSMMENTPSIKYKDLINPSLHNPIYNETLLERFIDHELKSDSTKANTGVVWKMTSQDKLDIISYLKTL